MQQELFVPSELCVKIGCNAGIPRILRLLAMQLQYAT